MRLPRLLRPRTFPVRRTVFPASFRFRGGAPRLFRPRTPTASRRRGRRLSPRRNPVCRVGSSIHRPRSRRRGSKSRSRPGTRPPRPPRRRPPPPSFLFRLSPSPPRPARSRGRTPGTRHPPNAVRRGGASLGSDAGDTLFRGFIVRGISFGDAPFGGSIRFVAHFDRVLDLPGLDRRIGPRRAFGRGHDPRHPARREDGPYQARRGVPYLCERSSTSPSSTSPSTASSHVYLIAINITPKFEETLREP